MQFRYMSHYINDSIFIKKNLDLYFFVITIVILSKLQKSSVTLVLKSESQKILIQFRLYDKRL